jgi:hypothetical protein
MWLLWHGRLGHKSQQQMNSLVKEDLLKIIRKIYLSTCEYFSIWKIARKPFRKGIRAEFPLQLIHSDICGSINARRVYFITFIDDFTW